MSGRLAARPLAGRFGSKPQFIYKEGPSRGRGSRTGLPVHSCMNRTPRNLAAAIAILLDLIFCDWDETALWLWRYRPGVRISSVEDARLEIGNVERYTGSLIDLFPTIRGKAVVLERTFESYDPEMHNAVIEAAAENDVLLLCVAQRATGGLLFEWGIEKDDDDRDRFAVMAIVARAQEGIEFAEPQVWIDHTGWSPYRRTFERERRARRLKRGERWMDEVISRFPPFKQMDADVREFLGGDSGAVYEPAILAWLSVLYEDNPMRARLLSDLGASEFGRPGFHRSQFNRRVSTIAARRKSWRRTSSGYIKVVARAERKAAFKEKAKLGRSVITRLRGFYTPTGATLLPPSREAAREPPPVEMVRTGDTPVPLERGGTLFSPFGPARAMTGGTPTPSERSGTTTPRSSPRETADLEKEW
jgi:hypothetical protein